MVARSDWQIVTRRRTSRHRDSSAIGGDVGRRWSVAVGRKRQSTATSRNAPSPPFIPLTRTLARTHAIGATLLKVSTCDIVCSNRNGIPNFHVACQTSPMNRASSNRRQERSTSTTKFASARRTRSNVDTTSRMKPSVQSMAVVSIMASSQTVTIQVQQAQSITNVVK